MQIVSDDEAVVITASGEATASISTQHRADARQHAEPGRQAGRASHRRQRRQRDLARHGRPGRVDLGGQDRELTASGDVSSEAEAEAGIFADGAAGLAFGLEFSNADIQTTMNGNVTAHMKPGSVVKIEIDPTETDPNAVGYVDYAEDMIYVGPNALVTEDTITYTNRLRDQHRRARDDGDYRTYRRSTDCRRRRAWIKLAETETQAHPRRHSEFHAGNVVDLTSTRAARRIATADNDAASSRRRRRRGQHDRRSATPRTRRLQLQHVRARPGGRLPPGHARRSRAWSTAARITDRRRPSENNLQGNTRFADRRR